MALNDEQKGVIDAMAIERVCDVICDMLNDSPAMTPTTFLLATHPAFRSENATPRAIADYLVSVVDQRLKENLAKKTESAETLANYQVWGYECEECGKMMYANEDQGFGVCKDCCEPG